MSTGTNPAADELQHLKLALEGAELGTFDHDLASRFVRVSPQACRIYAIPVAAQVTLDEMLAHADAEGLAARQRAFQAALHPASRGSYQVDYRLMPPGGPRWISVRARVLFAPAAPGEPELPVRVVGVVADITVNKQRELSLQAASGMLHAVGDSTSAFMYVKDTDGRILYCNDAVLKALGKPAAEVIGRTDAELAGPGPRTEAIMAHDRQVMRSGETMVYTEHLEGIQRSYLSTKTPFRDPKGQVIGLAGVSMDVTELEQVRQALRDSEERAALATQGAEIGVYDWDPATNQLAWSNALRQQFGVDLADVVTIETAIARIHPDDRDRVLQALATAMDPAGQGRYDIEYRTVPVQGEVRWLHVLGRVQFKEMEGVRSPTRFQGVSINITRQKAMELALREADRRKDEFLAMLAHELRNPLAPLTYAADTLARRPDDPAQVLRLSGVIRRQAHHMSRLVDDLLDASRLTLGKISIDPVALDFAAVAAAAAATVFTATVQAQRRTEVSIEPPAVWVAGDAVRLTQLVTNLLQNAIKFTAPGGRVALSLRCAAGQAVLVVEDDGQGIDPGLLPRVFDLFVQGDQPLDRQSGGLGIGLSLVRALAELHHGSVQADSAGAGAGARFTVRLPLTSAPPPATRCGKESDGVAQQRILIVEDNVDAGQTLQAMLELQGHAVSLAHDGLTGLAMAQREHPDLMLVDIGLPGISGFELARRLRSGLTVQPRRLIALTGYGSATDREQALAAGFDHHLVKPVTYETLMLALR